MHFVRLPSGYFLNLARVSYVGIFGGYLYVYFSGIPQNDEVSFRENSEDARFLLAKLEALTKGGE